MDDHSDETLDLQQQRDDDDDADAHDEEYASELLGGDYPNIFLDEDTLDWILNHIDCFLSQSRGNESVEEVYFYPCNISHGHDDYEVWDKVGQAIGNLQALTSLHISPRNNREEEEEEEDYPTPDWEILARILSQVRQKISLNIFSSPTIRLSAWRAEDSRSLALVIRGHPTITSFRDNGKLPYELLDTLYSALATLPALEEIRLSKCEQSTRLEEESALVNPKILTELLRVPTLRFVDFHCFYFTRALCQATANAFIQGTAFTNLEFWNCSFSAGECADMMANGLGRNTSVTCIEVKCINVVPPWDGTLYNALARALPLNSTLQELSLKVIPSDEYPDTHVDWSPIFLALGKNTGIKILIADVPYSMDESLYTAMQNGLGMNETLENLQLNHVPLYNDNADLWCRAFSFLRTNKALKSLIIRLDLDDVTRFCVSASRFDIAAMLQENASLETLTVRSWGSVQIKAEEYLVLIATLQRNKTLKFLSIDARGCLTLARDEDKQMAALLYKNYALESLPDFNLRNEAGDTGAILRLNESGRRYLIEDGSSISKGVRVLSAVSNEINCVFLHLLENPRLCDRSAVEMAASDITCTDDGGEHDQAQTKGT